VINNFAISALVEVFAPNAERRRRYSSYTAVARIDEEDAVQPEDGFLQARAALVPEQG
jgi:hypothetical protein